VDAVTAFFAWPNGGVWSNLVASILWTVPALVWHHKTVMRKLDRHHAETMREVKSK
jgi:hypothetical protein